MCELLEKANERESQIRAALSEILSSPVFEASPGSGRLLTFLVEEDLSSHTDNLKETYIGHMLYRRPATYDPKFDSVVRVNANRLRNRLLEYYAENRTVSPRITVRPGSYVPTYEFDAEVTGSATRDLESADVVDTEPVAPEIPWHQDEAAGTARLFNVESRQDKTSRAVTWPRHRWVARGIGVILVATLIAMALLVWSRKAAHPAEWTGELFSSLGGQEEFVAISPDGQKLAFSWTEQFGGLPHIYIQGLNEHTPKRLTSRDDRESRPAWSPDGSSIAYLHLLSQDRTEVIVRSLSEGSEIKVADLHGSYPWLCTIPRLSWAPDGKKIFTNESVSGAEECRVVAINVATKSIQLITQPPPGSIGDLESAVSPNGSQVAFLRGAGTLGGDIYVTPSEGGAVRRVTFDRRDIMGFCWMPDGSGFIVSSRRGDGVPKLWQLSLDGKMAMPLTDGLTLAAFPAISAQGNRIAFTTYHTTASIWQVANGSEKLLISDQSFNSTPQISPDGRSLVYRSDRTGSFELWISQLDGENGVRLTDFKGPMVNNPRWSPDAKWIAFECRPQGHSDICLVSPSHPAQTHVLNQWTSNEIFPSWSSDGKNIYFTSNYSGRWEIYRQAVDGGDPVAITHDGGMRALQSVDGRWLYIFLGKKPEEIVRIPASDQPDNSMEANKATTILSTFSPDMLGRWDIDQNGPVYLMPSGSKAFFDPSGKENVIAIDGDTKVPQNIRLVDGPIPPGDLVFSVLADGKSFVYVKQGRKEGNIGFLLFEPAQR